MKRYLKNKAVNKFLLIVIALLAGLLYVSEVNLPQALSHQTLNLQSPGDREPPGPAISTLNPTLRWSSFADDSMGMPYYVRIAKKPYGSNNVVYEEPAFHETVTVPPEVLKEDKFYCWNVAPPGGVIMFSDCLYFNTGGEWEPEPQPEEHKIIISSKPPEGGFPLGEGTYKHGDEVSLSAHNIKEGYKFKNWTEDGKIVHTGKSYVFKVDRDRTLVANFEKVQHSIKVFSNPPESGIVFFDGNQEFVYDNGFAYSIITCDHGEKVKLSAVVKSEMDCVFVNWTENGKIVHQDRDYEFIANKNRELTMNFFTPLQASLYGHYEERDRDKPIQCVKYAGQLLNDAGIKAYLGTKKYDDANVALNRLPNDVIFFFLGHSALPEKKHESTRVLSFPEPDPQNETNERQSTYLKSKDIQETDLEYLQLVVLAACGSADNVQCEDNILRSFINSGAQVGVGFSDGTPTLDAYKWSDAFWQAFVKNQLTVHEASLTATWKRLPFPLAPKMPWEEGVEEHLPVTYPVEKAREITIEDILEGAER